MDDPLLMGGFEWLSDLFGYRQCLINRDRPLLDPISQCWPLHQLQHQRTSVFGFLDTVNLRDVWMVEAGEYLRLSLEPGETIRIGGKRLGQNLQRHLPVQFGIRGLIDLSHPPPRR